MGARTAHLRNPKDVIRRLHALADDIDRAVRAAARVRRELERAFRVAQLGLAATPRTS